VEEGRPCHDIFHCDPDLLCYTPVESDFHNVEQYFMAPSDFVRDPLMCSICASTSQDAGVGQVDAELKTMYAVMLSICATCKSKGAIIDVGRYLPNDQAIFRKAGNLSIIFLIYFDIYALYIDSPLYFDSSN